MSIFTDRKREKIHAKIHQLAIIIKPEKPGDFEPLLREIFDEIYEDVEFLENEKAPQSEIKLLILEMREGFRQMEIRFDAMQIQMDRRFEAVDKRFEAVDRRFEDLIHHMDKRFEAVDRRFSSIQWFLGLGFTILALIMAFFRFYNP